MSSAWDIPDPMDIRSALFFSHIDAMLVSEVVAAWKKHDGRSIGVVVRMADKTYRYIVHEWWETLNEGMNRRTTTMTFKSEPAHLYKRALIWYREGTHLAKINQDLGYAKADAKYGSPARADRESVSGSVFRIQG